uniref:Uncharacterized protein n=1 Tax=Vitis vinifera TaxID=29760 RepID=A5C7G3_VITVI|nr:hypothetical protein VITISV_028020 [Vitis vinifera]
MAKQPKTKKNSATGEFNSEEMEKLKSLLGSLDKPTGTYSLALSGFGDIYITPTLILKNVLHEQGSGRRIGLAKERSGLYHLESS